jgi:hypothetical protein
MIPEFGFCHFCLPLNADSLTSSQTLQCGCLPDQHLKEHPAAARCGECLQPNLKNIIKRRIIVQKVNPLILDPETVTFLQQGMCVGAREIALIFQSQLDNMELRCHDKASSI